MTVRARITRMGLIEIKMGRVTKMLSRSEVAAELLERLAVTDESTWGHVNLILLDRIEHLEQTVLLLAKHVGAVGWNYELQKALDQVREPHWHE